MPALTRRSLLMGAAIWTLAAPARAVKSTALVSPQMRLAGGDAANPRVALTFDACDGGVDGRILDLLETAAIPATIFVSGLWLARNKAAFARLLTRPDLFEIGNHGARHHAAIDQPMRLWTVPAAGSPAAVGAEVIGGALAIVAAGGVWPVWFRGATAEYTATALTEIAATGFRVAGFSLNGDEGAELDETATLARYRAAKDGTIIISHVNQPHRQAGAGVVAGIKALQTRGFGFVRLSGPGVVVV